LDVSGNTILESLYCSDNLLSSLDITNNALLEHLRCRNNQLTNLDLSNNTALRDINCGGNQLTSLDISQNIYLGETIWPDFDDVVLDSMPTLYEVCVWELPFPPEGVEIDTTVSPNVFFTTECSK
jgi:hypothetical protein